MVFEQELLSVFNITLLVMASGIYLVSNAVLGSGTQPGRKESERRASI
jgi:hypothetical protein